MSERPQHTADEHQRSLQRNSLLIATITSFTIPFTGSSVNVALPAVQESFRMNAVLLSWVATAYLLSAAIFLVPMGRLADIYGRRKVFSCGIVTFTGASLLCGLSVSGILLIAFRVIQGIGAAMIFATGIAILTSVFPAQQRGRALGINVAAVYTGLSLGPLMGGLLTQHATWRGVFFFNVPLGLFIVVLVVWKLRAEWAGARGEPFDLQGSVIYGLALVAVMYGIMRLPAGESVGIILLGLAGLGGFVLWEMRVEYPVFDLRLFARNRTFTFSCVAALVHYSATFGVTFLLSLYLQYIKGFSPQKAGLILVAQPAMMAVLSPFAGKLSDRVEPRVVASAGMALTTSGLVLFVFLDRAAELTVIVGGLLLLGVGYGLFSSPNMNAIMGSVDKQHFGLASGSVGTMRLLGMMVSMAIATVIFTLVMGRVQITVEHFPEFMKSVRGAFAIFSLLCFGGIFSSIARGDLRGHAHEP